MSDVSEKFEVLETLRFGGAGRSTLRRVRIGDRFALLKDFSSRGKLFRTTVGRFMMLREAAAYARLAGVEGIARFIGCARPDGLFLEFVEGATPARSSRERLTSEYFQQLGATLRSVRARGVLHGDIGRNALVGADGRPLLVDFGASFVIPRWLGPLRATLLRWGELHDERAIVKLKARTAPRLMSPEDQQMLRRRIPLEWPLELFEKLLRRIVRQLTGDASLPH